MKKVLLLLAQGFEIYEASVFIDVIGWNYEEGDNSTQLFTCALKKEIKSTFNQKFVVDYLIDDINPDDFDALAVPGGFEQYGFYEDVADERFKNIIRDFHKKDKPVASICVGAIALGRTGILEGKKGTTYQNPVRLDQLSDCGVNVLKKPIVTEGNIITSWNPSTAIGVALTLLEWLTSRENANKVRELMGFEEIKL